MRQGSSDHQRKVAAAAGVSASERWLKAEEAARRARCGLRRGYDAARAGHLQAARIDARGTLRFLPEAVDAWVSGGARIGNDGTRNG